MAANICLQTTVIGSYPKPAYMKLTDWFKDNSVKRVTKDYSAMIAEKGMNELIDKAEDEVLREQVGLGINIITDGEIRRENYMYYLLRHLKGFDFFNLTDNHPMRNPKYVHSVPTIVGPLEIVDESKLAGEWRKCQDVSEVPVKYTIPGPMTIIESTSNKFYSDVEKLSEAIVLILKKVIKELVKAGCKHIQIDEPLFARIPARAIDYGIRHAASCFQDVGSDVTKIIHICCGYPDRLDQTDYLKADRSSYLTLAGHLDEAVFDAVSIEDAHCHNDLSFLKMFTKTSVILGCVAIAKSQVESVAEIQERICEALKYIPAERLQIAPDCGLGYLPHDILVQKLTNMVTAAKLVNI
ncbi:5-methyltetrahydropteroyltriglutamate--homocysteine methyltransferase-like [Anneissia japonica]|uniref:5-methyltetrahydropteroyltriglutamate-- homocysteine methyltransferase-like n=1 Tax=Anneissia japonica TaxID=1529436 RepID=UPI00142576D4|nr:5-methyltetrahydropteroyltriglutamate--homocysteine methyltransferase-like [Anneissia japonica]